jgi:hypothetical protein
METTKAARTVERVMRLLAKKDYESLLRFAPLSDVTADELKIAVEEYPAELMFPPVAIESLMDVVEVRDSHPRSWYVGVDLWTKEEGRSDLTLEMHLREAPGDFYSVEIDGLHVL